MAAREVGRIKFYRDDKKYGFINRQGGGDIFFHVSALEPGVLPETGQCCEFSVGEGRQAGTEAALAVVISN